MTFPAGYKVVHKTHGVGEIQGVESLTMGGQSQDYYILKILASGLMVRFPKINSPHVIRELVSDDDIARIFAILGEPPKTYSAIWNRRKKEFTDKIRSGSLFEIAEVLRDLSGKDRLRQPSYGEKEMIDRAKARLVSEISAAKCRVPGEVEHELDEALESKSRASS